MNKLAHGISFGLLPSELIIDNFAGGGGASLGIEMALCRSPDIAINHDREAIAMHMTNHPDTKHYCEDVWEVNPIEACGGRAVGLAWFSPDCKHFSKAKGGKPVSKKIRGLAWIVVKWAKAVQPRVIILENVEEFQDWGPLDDEGFPCPERKGKTFQRWLAQLRNLGYHVEWRELRACDYSAPTIRKRLFIVARRDGQRIVWPEPTHGNPKKIGADLFSSHLRPWRTAAECIDWSIPCPSIFDRKKPLAENTLRRIAAGLRRFVIDCPEPFIVRTAHGTFGPNSRRWGKGEHPIDEPLPTVAASGDFAICTPFLAGVGGRAGQSPERSPLTPYQTITSKADAAVIAPLLVGTGGPSYSGKPRTADQPFYTMTAESRAAVVTAFLAQYNTTGNGKPNVGHQAGEPFSTITSNGCHQSLVTSNLVKLRGTCRHGQPVDEPMATISAQGLHLAEVRAFLIAYYGNERDGASLHEPMRTTTSKERFGLVTIHGEDYVIADIGLRMLTPRELYRAQGFHDGYVIDFEFEGKPLSKTAQVRMCGNSVCPPNAAAMVRAQFGMSPVELAA
jgi:DNA (cytosine-5)-methyltransferase 1